MRGLTIGMAHFFERLLAYRVDVYLLTFLTVLSVQPRLFRFDPQVILIATCFSSLMAFVYLFNKTTDLNEDAVNTAGGPIATTSIESVRILAWLCAIVPAIVLWILTTSIPLLVVYLIVGVLGYFYSKPLPFLSVSIRLKQLLGGKTFTSTCILVLPPLGGLIGTATVIVREEWLILLVIASISAAIEISWDVRDMRGDAAFGIRTIPNTFGLSVSKGFMLTLLALAAVAGYFLGLSHFSYAALLLSAFFILATREGRGYLYYHGIVLTWIAALSLYIIS